MAGPLRTSFRYDVFLSHSSAEKPVVRELAERLRDAGLRVWLDEWIVQPGDLISQKIEDGLEQSALLLFCMSANAFGSDWVTLESHSAIFRDPLNRDRRFVPLRLDDAPIKAMFRGYAYLDWRPGADREKEWGRLLAVTSIWPPAAALSRSSRSNSTENRWIWPVFNAGAIGLCEMASGPDRSEPIQAAKGLETAPQACGSLAGPLRIPLLGYKFNGRICIRRSQDRQNQNQGLSVQARDPGRRPGCRRTVSDPTSICRLLCMRLSLEWRAPRRAFVQQPHRPIPPWPGKSAAVSACVS